MFSDIISVLRCPICGSAVSGDMACANNHKFSLVEDAADFLVNPAKEITTELSAAKRDAEINRQMFLGRPFTEKQLFEYNLIAKDIQKYIGPKKYKVILELGSGHCYVAHKIAAAFPDSQIIASDIYFPNIEETERGPININKVVSSMDKLPFKDKSIDVIFVMSALHHASKLKAVFSECYRVLKKGGCFLIFDEITTSYFEPNKATNVDATSKGYNDRLYGLSDYKSAAKNAGFVFSLKFPSIMKSLLKRMPPNKERVKPAKRVLAKIIHNSRLFQILVEKCYPILLYFVILPSFFVCAKNNYNN